MRFPKMRFQQLQGGGGGGGLNMATGLPFVETKQETGSSTGSKRTEAAPGFLRALQGGEDAFGAKRAATLEEMVLKEREAAIRANIAGGYGPLSGIAAPVQSQPIPGSENPFESDTPPTTPPAAPDPLLELQGLQDPFETKREIGRAAKDAAYMRELERQKARSDLRVKEAHAEYDKRYEEAVAAQKIPGFWDDKTEEQKSQVRLGMWLLSFGDKGPSALKYINDAIDRDTKKKQDRADRLLKLADMAKGREADAYRMRAEELSNSTLNHAAMLKGLEDYGASYIATMVPAQQRAEASQKLAEVDIETNKWLAQGHQELNADKTWDSGHTVTTTGLGAQGARPTEAEGKYGLFSDTIAGDIDILRSGASEIPEVMSKVQDNLTELEGAQKSGEKGPISAKGVSWLRGLGVTPRSAYSGMTGRQQQLGNAVDSSSEMVNRAISGAAIGGSFTAGEESRLRRALSFSPDMSPELVGQVTQRLERVGQVMGSLSGRALKQALFDIAEDRASPKSIPGQAATAPAAGAAPRKPSTATPAEAAQLKRDLIAAHKALLDTSTDQPTKAAARRFIKENEMR